MSGSREKGMTCWEKSHTEKKKKKKKKKKVSGINDQLVVTSLVTTAMAGSKLIRYIHTQEGGTCLPTEDLEDHNPAENVLEIS